MCKLIGVFLLFATFIPIESEAKYPSLRFALYMSASSVSYQNVFLPFAENVNKDSHGELNISLYPSGVLGRNPTEQIYLVRLGHADIAVVIPSLATEVFPGTEVTLAPGLIHNATEGSIAIWRTYNSMELLQSEGLRILGLFVTYPDIIHTRKNVNSLKDINGLNLRTSSKIQSRLISQLGAKPIEFPVSEAYTALQSGFLDGAVMTWDLTERLKLNEVLKYHYDMPLGSVMVALIMNDQRYQQLSSKARYAIDRNSGEKLAKIWGEVYDHQNTIAEKKIKEKGGNVIEPSYEDEMRLEKEAHNWLKNLDGISSKLVNTFLEKIKDVREELKP